MVGVVGVVVVEVVVCVSHNGARAKLRGTISGPFSGDSVLHMNVQTGGQYFYQRSTFHNINNGEFVC